MVCTKSYGWLTQTLNEIKMRWEIWKSFPNNHRKWKVRVPSPNSSCYIWLLFKTLNWSPLKFNCSLTRCRDREWTRWFVNIESSSPITIEGFNAFEFIWLSRCPTKAHQELRLRLVVSFIAFLCSTFCQTPTLLFSLIIICLPSSSNLQIYTVSSTVNFMSHYKGTPLFWKVTILNIFIKFCAHFEIYQKRLFVLHKSFKVHNHWQTRNGLSQNQNRRFWWEISYSNAEACKSKSHLLSASTLSPILVKL